MTLWTKQPKEGNGEDGHHIFAGDGDNLASTAVNTGEGFYALYNWTLPQGNYQTNTEYTLTFTTPSQFKAINTGAKPLTTTDGDRIGMYKVSGRDVTINFNFTDEQKDLIALLADSEMLGQFWIGHGFSLSAEELEKDKLAIVFDENDTQFPRITIEQKQEEPTPKIVKVGGKIIDDDGNVSIKWTVDVNNTKATIGNATLTDKLPAGLTITKVTKQAFNVSKNGTFTTAVTGSTATEITNYSTKDNTVTFTLGKLEQPYRIMYYTEIAEDKQTETQTFKNEATFKGTDYKSLTDSDSVTINFGKPLVKEAVSYSEAKQFATWRISYNEDHKKVARGVITDTFKSGESYAEQEYVKITKVTKIDKDGNETTLSPSTSGIQAKPNGTTGVTFEMPKDNNQYIFEYTTAPTQRLTGGEKLGNSASLERESNQPITTGGIDIIGRQGVGVKTENETTPVLLDGTTTVKTKDSKVTVNYVVKETDTMIVKDGNTTKVIKPTIQEDCHVTIDFKGTDASCAKVVGEKQENGKVTIPVKATPGEYYDLYDRKGNVVARDVRANNDGSITVDDELANGKYTLTPSNGNGEEVTFAYKATENVAPNAVNNNVSNNNAKSNSTSDKAALKSMILLPQTGTQVAFYTLFGIVLIGAALCLFKRSRRKAS